MRRNSDSSIFALFLIIKLVTKFFSLVFLYMKIPRITLQGYKISVERSVTGSRTEEEENPTYATTISVFHLILDNNSCLSRNRLLSVTFLLNNNWP
jgi:hypothetical protein